MKKVFEPVQQNNLRLKNRLVRSATWEGLAQSDGSLTKETYAIYAIPRTRTSASSAGI